MKKEGVAKPEKGEQHPFFYCLSRKVVIQNSRIVVLFVA